ncbi:uracil-DNA glycosylase [Pelagibaculum spongiae]
MPTWGQLLKSEEIAPTMAKIKSFLDQERAAGKVIFPPQAATFFALQAAPFDQIKVVILGQDPYHGPNQAHGLCFSVAPGVKTPPSLKNIYKEQAADLGITQPAHGHLSRWAEQGILMLNTVLSVEAGNAHSHAKIGWEVVTDFLIKTLGEHHHGLVFMLWGSHAQKKAQLLDEQKHHLLMSAHPSPLSAYRGFLGNRHFSQCNALLVEQGKAPIDWQLPQTG